MATTIIKDWDTDNQAHVTSLGELLVTSTGGGGGNASVGANGLPAPIMATEIAGIDPDGNLAPLQINEDGKLVVDAGTQSNGFVIAPGYPTQVAVGTTSTVLFAANPQRTYAHIANNSSEKIFVQYSSAAALNQGIPISAGSLYFISGADLTKGVVNAISPVAGLMIDVLEGE